MAAITGGLIAAGAAAYGANRASSGARDAARAQQHASDAATAEQRREYDLAMEMTAPRRAVEGQALNQLAALTGLRGSGGGNSGPIDPNTGQPMGVQGGGAPDYSAFYNSPDYQFALQQGLQATERSAAAGGNLRSGNTLAALTQYGQGLASQNFGNYISRLQSLAGMGADQAGANMTTQLGQNVANNIIGAGNARASGIAGAANAWSNFGGQVAQLGGYAMDRWGGGNHNSQYVTPGAATQAGNTGYGNYPGATPPYSPYGASRNYLYAGSSNA